MLFEPPWSFRRGTGEPVGLDTPYILYRLVCIANMPDLIGRTR